MDRKSSLITRAMLGIVLATSWIICLPRPSSALVRSANECAKVKSRSWTPQEVWVWNQLCFGHSADLDSVKKFGKSAAPTRRNEWSTARTLRPGFLRSILTEDPFAAYLSGRNLTITGGWVREPLLFRDSTVATSIEFDGFRFEKEVNFRNANIEGDLDFGRSAFAENVDIVGAEIDGSVLIDEADAQDLVMDYSDIGDTVELDESTFHGNVSIGSASIGGNVFIQNGIFQDVALFYSSIASSLVASDSTVHKTLDLTAGQVGGVTFLNRAKLQDVTLRWAHISGTLELYGASVGGYFDCNGLVLDGMLAMATGDETVKWGEGSVLDLGRASVAGVEDTPESWPGHVFLTGFVYKDLTGKASPAIDLSERDVKWYLKWLERGGAYSRQPYRQLEAALRSIGRSREADSIAIASRDREREEDPLPQKSIKLVHKLTVGYGYHPEYAIGWAVLFVLIGALMAKPLTMRVDAPSRLILSIERLIPLVSFGESYKQIDTSGAGPWVRRYFYLHALIGYILATFLIAALARITAT